MISTFVSIDIETTGLKADRADIVEIGAVVDDWLTPLPEPPEFHCYIKQDEYRGQPFALSMHPEIFRRIADEEEPYLYLYPGEACEMLGRFLKENNAYTPDPSRPDSEGRAVVAGKNFASFDDKFLRRLPKFDEHVKYHHRIIDPAMLYWNPLTDTKPPSTKTCMERAGLSGEVAHTALEDAKVVAKMIQIAVGRRVQTGQLLKIAHERGTDVSDLLLLPDEKRF